ncbi:hypothetical protein E3P77_02748 [Wallemia ichthyophaga]|uniref:F-box domain-containing protein n=1 Tax=Wallemia ichthyophaga TaxID=245174 RepID=A0A4T0EK87_WALIC|nr:hypothetical protein E3P91_00686 [Wallemia ichthyophaga]TIA80740.1 hypothetical protein E3P98_02521 [Wallemia ichthyophaga]TIB05266.1 hypothetical protein E3P96_01254 [Wallemia ichthyophaga]TIB34243.1 hypothetical protein E3P86_02856 [Wallemia ichthyophaga]TIB37435.1 hypothetical protein E3P84_00209 [Wallemia ichthyophaga]
MDTRSKTRKPCKSGQSDKDVEKKGMASLSTKKAHKWHKDPLKRLPNELIELVFGYLCHENNGPSAAHNGKLVNRAWYRAINTNYVYVNTFISTDENVGKVSFDANMSNLRGRFQSHIERCGYIRSVKLCIRAYNRMFLKGFFFQLLDVSPNRPFELIEVNYYGGPFNSEKKGFILTLTESLFGLTCKKLRMRNYSQLIGLNEAEVYHLTTFPSDLHLLNWRLKGDADTIMSTLSHNLQLEGKDVAMEHTTIPGAPYLQPTRTAVVESRNRSAVTFSCLIQCPELYTIKMKNSSFAMDRATLKWFRDNRAFANQLNVRKLRVVFLDSVCNVSWFLGMLRSQELHHISIENCTFGFPLQCNEGCLRNVTHLTLTRCTYEQTNTVDNRPRDNTSSLYDDMERSITYQPAILDGELLLKSLPKLESLVVKSSKSFSDPIIAVIHKFTIKHVVLE